MGSLVPLGIEQPQFALTFISDGELNSKKLVNSDRFTTVCILLNSSCPSESFLRSFTGVRLDRGMFNVLGAGCS